MISFQPDMCFDFDLFLASIRQFHLCKLPDIWFELVDMGSLCSRRRSAQPDVLLEQEGWLLIPPVSRPTFKTAVRRVITLLAIRKMWSEQGKQLHQEEAMDSRPRRLRQKRWSKIGILLQRRKQLFDHVVRQNGKLKYK
jgi:hypothetical protein